MLPRKDVRVEGLEWFQVLDDNNQLDRWYQVNTRKNPDELLGLMSSLQATLKR